MHPESWRNDAPTGLRDAICAAADVWFAAWVLCTMDYAQAYTYYIVRTHGHGIMTSFCDVRGVIAGTGKRSRPA